MDDDLARVGTTFGPYRLDSLLGRGGMGAVYRAYDTVRDRSVALKLLHAQLASDPVYQERFRRESQTLARLGEPHIIPIHDFGEIDGTLFLDMRLVEGRDLRAVLRDRGALEPQAASALIGQIAAALDAAHAAGLVHRDVKPENILVTDADFAYLVDFGIAHQQHDTHLTQAGTAIGSIAYMAPEQFDNEPLGPQADIYSLGAVLFECLTGRPPYPGDSVSTVLRRVVLDPVPAVSQANPAVPAALDPVLAGALAKQPAQRFSSAGQFATAVAAAAEQVSSTTNVVSPDPGRAYDQTMIGPSGPVGLGGPMVTGPTPGTAPLPPTGAAQPWVTGPTPPVPGYGPMYGAGPTPGTNPVVLVQQGRTGDRSKGMIIGLSALILLLLAGLIGLLVYKFTADDGDSSSGASASSSTVTVTSRVEPSATQPTVATPPPGSRACSSVVGVGSDMTTCEFAESVRQAYLAAGPKGESRRVTATSPITGQDYDMSCVPESGIVVCRGGNNAVVHIY